MKQTQQTRLAQTLKLTPHMKQGLDLLQLNNVDLQQIIEPILKQNPLLIKKETPVETTVENSEKDTTWEAFRISLWNPDQQADRFNFSDPNQNTLKQALESELNACFFSEEDCLIAIVMIDALDDHGYLTESIASLENLLKPHIASISKLKIEEVRQKIIAIEPYGIASRNLSEFLLCQLLHVSADESVCKLAALLITNYLDDVARHNVAALSKKTLYTSKELTRAFDLIHQLRPRPWLETSEPLLLSRPDLLLAKHHETWKVSINDNSLSRIYFDHAYYEKIAESCQNQPFFLNAYKEACNLILNLRRRTQTLLKTAQAIVDYQQAYLNGIARLKPLDLGLLSEKTQLHISTLSRAIKNKLIATPQGVIALKTLLSGSLSKESALSTHAIQAIIKQLIDAEAPHAPLADQAIVDILKSRYAISIARRTVAKYRTSLGILSVTLRKTPSK